MINPGEGYRLLGRDEEIRKGDEYLSFYDTWLLTQNTFGKVKETRHLCGRYRRKVEEKPIWRLLEEGEVIQDKDQYYSPTSASWFLCTSTRINTAQDRDDLPVRRLLKGSDHDKQIADLNKQLQELNDGLVETEKNLASLLKKNAELTNENKKLQQGINSRNEWIADLEFIVREIRKSH